MNSDEIQKKQNEDKYLKVQYAARVCYNSAETCNHLAWIACLVSAFSIFFPDSWPIYIVNGIPFIADIFAVILMYITSHQVKWASKFRRYFDSYVLNINSSQFKETDRREIQERVEKICLKNPKDATIQMSNTGRDSPPGVRNWYEFTKFYDGVDSQIECQRQNTWWNKKMFRKRFLVTVCASILIIVVFLLFTINNNIVTVILCSTGLIIKTAERLLENVKYIRISNLIEGAQLAVEAHPTKESVERLQELIDERRSINVLELNLFHRKYANILSNIYEKSTL